MTEEWPDASGGAPVLRPGEGGDRAPPPRRGGGPSGADLYLLRPPVVLGPHAVGAKEPPPRARSTQLGRRVGGLVLSCPCRCPSSSRRCRCSSSTRTTSARRSCSASWPPARPAPTTSPATVCSPAPTSRASSASPRCRSRRRSRGAARALRAPLPFLPPAAEWAEAATRPSIMDAGKAKRELNWKPRYTSLEALRDTTPAR